MTGQCRAWTTKSMCDPSWVMSVFPRWSPHWLSVKIPPAKDWDLVKLTGRKDRYQIWVVSHTACHRYFRDKLSGHNHHNPLTLGWWAYNLDSPRISVRNSQDLSAIFCSPKLNDMFHALHEPTRTNSHTPHFEHVNSSESTQKLQRNRLHGSVGSVDAVPMRSQGHFGITLNPLGVTP